MDVGVGVGKQVEVHTWRQIESECGFVDAFTRVGLYTHSSV